MVSIVSHYKLITDMVYIVSHYKLITDMVYIHSFTRLLPGCTYSMSCSARQRHCTSRWCWRWGRGQGRCRRRSCLCGWSVVFLQRAFFLSIGQTAPLVIMKLFLVNNQINHGAISNSFSKKVISQCYRPMDSDGIIDLPHCKACNSQDSSSPAWAWAEGQNTPAWLQTQRLCTQSPSSW